MSTITSIVPRIMERQISERAQEAIAFYDAIAADPLPDMTDAEWEAEQSHWEQQLKLCEAGDVSING